MRNSNKKGFTIVELVVVVAVIAILAAVLIPTVSGIIAKARLNADQQAVANMNKAAAMGAAEEDFTNAGDVVKALYAYGFNAGKLQTYSKGYHYAYQAEENEFYLLDEENKVVFPKGEEDRAINDLWGFFNNSKADKIVGVTHYIALSGINNATTFNGADCAFAPADGVTYTLDLNQYYIGVAGVDYVKILNGSVKKNSGFTLGTTVVEREAASASAITAPTATNAKVENAIITADTGAVSGGSAYFISPTTTKEIVFENCTLDFTVSGKAAEFSGADSYVFKNCVINMGTKNLQVRATANKNNVTFEDCYITGDRGIVVGGRVPNDNTTVISKAWGNIVFQNNTFVCTNSTTNRPSLQFTGNIEADNLVIKDNVFDCVDIAIRIHNDCAGLVAANYDLSGNKFNEKAVIIDGDDTGNPKSEAIAADLLAKFN